MTKPRPKLKTKARPESTGTPDRYYVVEIWGGIEPNLLGPFATEGERDRESQRVRAKQDSAYDATLALDVLANGDVDLYPYSGAFFDNGAAGG